MGGIIVGIIGLAPNYIQLEAEFDNTMDFFHSVYRDLIFQDTFDPGTGILNLLYREEKSTFGQRGPQRPGPGKLDLSKRSGMLAPVRSIDLDQGVVEYNSINLPKVTGGWGAAIRIVWDIHISIFFTSVGMNQVYGCPEAFASRRALMERPLRDKVDELHRQGHTAESLAA